MNQFDHREVSEVERRLLQYEDFVDSIQDGYSMSIFEYVNDLACRQYLEDKKSDSEVERIWPRVCLADKLLQSILIPTKLCIHGKHPAEYFCYWGYPPNSPELEEDLREIGAT